MQSCFQRISIEVNVLCQEFSSSRYCPKPKAMAATAEGTITGPVPEVHFLKIVDGHGEKFFDSINIKSRVHISR